MEDEYILRHQRDCLIEAITDAVITTRIVDSTVPILTGPECLQFLQDLVDSYVALTDGTRVCLPVNERQAKAYWLLGEDWIKRNAPENIKEPT
jgi:hypothetical protein